VIAVECVPKHAKCSLDGTVITADVSRIGTQVSQRNSAFTSCMSTFVFLRSDSYEMIVMKWSK
jgi:hypothetical protein